MQNERISRKESSRNSLDLRALGLTRSDVAVAAKYYHLKPDQAARRLITMELSGAIIKRQRTITRSTRSEAALIVLINHDKELAQDIAAIT